VRWPGPSSAKTPIREFTSLVGWIFPPRAQAATYPRELLARFDDHRALDDLVSQVRHQRVRGNAAFALKPPCGDSWVPNQSLSSFRTARLSRNCLAPPDPILPIDATASSQIGPILGIHACCPSVDALWPYRAARAFSRLRASRLPSVSAFSYQNLAFASSASRPFTTSLASTSGSKVSPVAIAAAELPCRARYS
jgi:hypothetical protein